MPTLDWIGKDAVIDHHREVPYHLLRENAAFSAGDIDSGNLLVQGDNLLALKALLPYYAGQVKCIYIDPPYNTGNEGWVYNDNVNSPEIRRWLGQVVGREAEDLSRHDKWLCMMYPRLMLLKEFLRPDGVIFISIGNDEVANLTSLCDEVFGRKNLLEILIWQIEGNTENQEDITSVHEYVLAYARKKGDVRVNTILDPNVPDDSKLRRDFVENSVVKNGSGNPASILTLPPGFPCQESRLSLPAHDFADEFVRVVEAGGDYIKREYRASYDVDYPIRLDPLIVDDGILVAPCRVYSGWSSLRKLQRFIASDCSPVQEPDGSELRYFVSHTGVPTYRREKRSGHFVGSILRNMGTTERSSNELERMGVEFDYPKPAELVRYLLSLYATEGALVMDSFAGSGTTGHAVLRLNHERQLGLRFILVELAEKVAGPITAKRLTAVCAGYDERRGKKTRHVAGLGGGFRYCELGPSLFHENGRVRDDVSYEDLARHVFFAETGQPLPGQQSAQPPLVGVSNDTAVYLLYNGVLKDHSGDGGNVLTRDVMTNLPAHDGSKVVYGAARRVSEEALRASGIVFRQTPYDIRTG